MRVDRFALTANNITYGVVGERIGYWAFFPPQDNADGGWGIIPVWGFADVVRSRCAEIPEGTRLYGYFPMASHWVMRPARVTEARMIDGSDHRQALPPVYNSLCADRSGRSGRVAGKRAHAAASALCDVLLLARLLYRQ